MVSIYKRVGAYGFSLIIIDFLAFILGKEIEGFFEVDFSQIESSQKYRQDEKNYQGKNKKKKREVAKSF